MEQFFFGLLACLILFALCFFSVHLIKLAKLGWLTKKTPPNEAKPTAPPEPVYYIVEKKKKRVRSDYAPPKEIHFK